MYHTACFEVTTTNTSFLSYQLMLEYSKGVTQFSAEAIFKREELTGNPYTKSYCQELDSAYKTLVRVFLDLL